MWTFIWVLPPQKLIRNWRKTWNNWLYYNYFLNQLIWWVNQFGRTINQLILQINWLRSSCNNTNFFKFLFSFWLVFEVEGPNWKFTQNHKIGPFATSPTLTRSSLQQGNFWISHTMCIAETCYAYGARNSQVGQHRMHHAHASLLQCLADWYCKHQDSSSAWYIIMLW